MNLLQGSIADAGGILHTPMNPNNTTLKGSQEAFPDSTIGNFFDVRQQIRRETQFLFMKSRFVPRRRGLAVSLVR